MKNNLFVIALATGILFGCAREVFTEGDKVNGEGFTCTLEGATKTTLGSDSTVRWETADLIKINGVEYKLSSEAGTTSAKFKKVNDGDADPEAPYKAFFADGNGGSWNDGKYSLPASYNYKKDGFNMPMYAQGNSESLTFKNLCGVLKLSVSTLTADKVSKIEVSSEGQLNGEFTADENGSLTFSSKASLEDSDKMIALNFSTPLTLGTDATVFYIPVAPGSHKLTVKVYNGESFSSISMPVAFDFERNKLYSLSDTKLAYTGDNPANAR